ncbi:hypothetical protein AB0N09_35700 [Streptomyces erythrochromogenes]|uniref:hypothetical protein n=1 Tax=Streptomyces erythrochromogenes TaxID=285574 RepID=UPI00341461A7
MFGGIVTAETPILPIGSKLPASLPGVAAAARDTAPPPLPTLTDEQEQQARVIPSEPPPAQAGIAAGEMGVQSFPYVSVASCRNTHGETNAATYVDRFNWCAVRPTVIYTFNTEGTIVGTTTFRMVTAGKGAKGKSGTIDGRRTYFTTGMDRFLDVGQVTKRLSHDFPRPGVKSGIV